jgi:uncharacterized protein with NRDE domain
MCLIVFAFDDHPDYELILGANRDEFYERPTTPARFWKDHPHVLAGRDEKAGGTWMGVTRSGAWAAITNVRNPGLHDPDAPSRGRLVSDYLEEEPNPRAYLEQVDADAYNGFNLLVGTPHEVRYLSNVDNGIREIDAGVHGLSNRVLNAPWPKVEAARERLRDLDPDPTGAVGPAPDGEDPPEAGDPRLPESADDPVAAVLDLLDDREPFPDEALPDTGVGLETERMLSPIFIESESYGTRSSTVLLIGRDGTVTFAEKTFDRGAADATRRFHFRVRSDATGSLKEPKTLAE